MFDLKTAQKLANTFVNSLSPKLKLFQQELESQLVLFLQKSLNSMDLVTREEFDIQTQVLSHTRKKLQHLEEVLEKFRQPDP